MKRRMVTKPPPPVESTLAFINAIIDGTCLRCGKAIPADSPSDIYCATTGHDERCCSLMPSCDCFIRCDCATECSCERRRHQPGECTCGGRLTTCQDDVAVTARQAVPALPVPAAEGRRSAPTSIQPPTWPRSGTATAGGVHVLGRVEVRTTSAFNSDWQAFNLRGLCACGEMLRYFSQVSDRILDVARAGYERALIEQFRRMYILHAVPELAEGEHLVVNIELVAPGGEPWRWPEPAVVTFTCSCRRSRSATSSAIEHSWELAMRDFEQHREEEAERRRLAVPATFDDLGALRAQLRNINISLRTPQIMAAAGELGAALRRAAEASAGGDVTYVVDSDSNEQEGD